MIRSIDPIACRVTCAVLRPPARVIGLLSSSEVLTSVRTRRPNVALTIDDGPHPATSLALLEVLRKHGARATFFLIGERAKSYPELVSAIARDGHELGLHLMRDEASVRLPPAVFVEQLREETRLLAPHGPLRFFRPGHGWFTRRMLRDAAELGYRCALASPLLVSADPSEPGISGDILARRAHPGAILVIHEGAESRAAVVTEADHLLRGLSQRSLWSTSLSDLRG